MLFRSPHSACTFPLRPRPGANRKWKRSTRTRTRSHAELANLGLTPQDCTVGTALAFCGYATNVVDRDASMLQAHNVHTHTTCTHTRRCTTCIHTRAGTQRAHTCAHKLTHTHTHTRTHTCTGAHNYTGAHTHRHTHTHTNTQPLSLAPLHIRTHTYTHTHAHTLAIAPKQHAG